MKKLFTITLLILLAGSFLFAQKSKNYEIKFNLKGVEDGTSNITIFYGSNETKMNKAEFKNGEYVMKGEIDAPAVFRLSFKNKGFLKMVSSGGYYPSKASSMWLVVYPGAKFNVSGSLEGKDYIDIYPIDKKENKYLAELNSQIMPLINSSLNVKLDIDKNKNLGIEEKKKLEEKSDDFYKQSNKAKVNFINKRPNSIAALWIMEDMLIRSEIEPGVLETILTKVDIKKYGTCKFYLSVKDRLEGAKQTTAGNKCPSIISTDSYDGKPFSDLSMRGKYMFIDFWGTWCGPCMAGVPKMKAFRNKFADKLQILGISNDKDVEKWKSVIAEKQMDWPNIRIGKGEKDFVNKFNVQGFPTKILVSPDGIILLRGTGEQEEFYSEVEKLLK